MQVPSPAAPGRLRTDGRKAPQPGHADTPALRVGEHVRAGGEGPDVGPGEGTGTRGQERARSALQRAVGAGGSGRAESPGRGELDCGPESRPHQARAGRPRTLRRREPRDRSAGRAARASATSVGLG